MKIHKIAKQVSKEHELPIDNLRLKEYKKNGTRKMKEEFVYGCIQNGISVKDLMKFMDHGKSTVYRLYNDAGGEFKFKHEEILDKLKEGPVEAEPDPIFRAHIGYLRSKGYHIYQQTKYVYKLSQ